MELDDGPNFSDDEILPEARVFEFRAKNILKSKLQALQELRNNMPEDLEEEDETPSQAKSKKPRSKKVKKGKSEDEDEDFGCQSFKRGGGTPTGGNEDASRPRRSRRGAPVEFEDISPPKKAKRGKGKKAKKINPEGLISSIKLPAISERRIQELKLNSVRLQRRIDMENERIISACDATLTEVEVQPPEDIESEQSIILKIQYLSDISKMRVKVAEKFSSVFEKVGNLHNLQPSEILLCFKDQTIKPSDTPQSLNLKYFDIIDCLPYKMSEDRSENDTIKFLLKMQSNDMRKKIDVYGSRLEKFEDFMKRYAEIRNIPMEKMSFEFDGEKLEGSETPHDLEVESGSCIDVTIKTGIPKPTTQSQPTSSSNPDVEITKEIVSESNMLQICVLD